MEETRKNWFTEDYYLREMCDIRILGDGKFGRVALVKDKKTQKEMALKYIDIKLTNKRNFEREASILRCLGTGDGKQYILDYYGHCEMKKSVKAYCILMEYFNGNDLKEIITDYHLKRSGLRILLPQFAMALHHLHQNSIIYRDLKCENTMVDISTGQLKLIDFGLSEMATYTKGVKGTPGYQAPELLQQLFDKHAAPYDHRIDIYSLGATLFRILYDVSTLNAFLENGYTKEKATDRILKGKLFYPSKLRGNIVDLLERLLECDPDERLTIAELIVHPFLRGAKAENVVKKGFRKHLIRVSSDSKENLNEMPEESVKE